ncbi:MAG: hypothetical protein AAGH89_07920 [Verrucomicrobiota bacterium]
MNRPRLLQLFGIAALVAMTIWAAFLAGRDPLFSSPTAKRYFALGPPDDWVTNSLEFRQKIDKPSGRALDRPFPPMMAERTADGDLLVGWGPDSHSGGSATYQPLWLPDAFGDSDQRIPTNLGGVLTLAAFAVCVPNSETLSVLKFLSPTLKPADETLREGELPPACWEGPQPHLLQGPRLRLIFHRSDLSAFRFRHDVFATDARSKVLLGYGALRHLCDQWSMADIDLEIWHDTPIQLTTSVMEGNKSLDPIPGSTGYQLAPGSRFSYQHIGIFTGLAELARNPRHLPLPESCEEGYLIQMSETERSKSVIGFGTDDFQVTMAVVGASGEGPFWFNHIGCGFVSTTIPADIEPASPNFLFFPNCRRCYFKIDGLPQMPNGRDAENLFDVEIPYIGKDWDPIRVALSATECRLSIQGRIINFRRPESLEQTTPRQILTEYLEQNGYRAHTRNEMYLIIDTRPPFPERIKNWWEDVAPRWLK